MADARKLLIFAAAVLGGFGLIAASMPFIVSLGPSEKAKAERDAWHTPPVPDLVPGQVLQRQVSKSKRLNNMNGSWTAVWGKRDLLIRDYDGAYYSYRFPTWEGSVMMPGKFWGQWEGECNDYGPKIINGKLVKGTTIQCNDPDFGNWPSKAESGH